jgi:ketosteroid isomerase-like protein
VTDASNLDVVRSVGSAVEAGFQDGDFGLLAELLDPQVEWHDQRELPGATVHHGIDGVIRHLSAAREALDYAGFELLEMLDARGSVVTVTRFSARGRASGAPVERDVATVWTLQDRRVVRVSIFGTRNEALEAVRLTV